MKTYLRRLWAALLNRPFQPLDMGSPIAFRGPSGQIVRVEVHGVTYDQYFRGEARLTIEARPPICRMEHHTHG